MNLSFPPHATTVGKRIEYLSTTVLPGRRFDDYVILMGELLDPAIHYIDPVHELRDRESVLQMLVKVVPRVCNNQYEFLLISENDQMAIWRWTIAIKIRWTPFNFIIHGLVHAQIQGGKIIYQREYYDPMESIGVIPIVGRIYKLILRLG